MIISTSCQQDNIYHDLKYYAKKENKKSPGDDLLSHVSAVPSALKGLASVFGMRTGVSPTLKSPGQKEHIKLSNI
jgi:hypothetical protein